MESFSNLALNVNSLRIAGRRGSNEPPYLFGSIFPYHCEPLSCCHNVFRSRASIPPFMHSSILPHLCYPCVMVDRTQTHNSDLWQSIKRIYMSGGTGRFRGVE